MLELLNVSDIVGTEKYGGGVEVSSVASLLRGYLGGQI